MEQLQSHTVYEEGLPNMYMRKCANISPYMRMPLVIYCIDMTLQLVHSEFPYIWGKFDFLFYQWSDVPPLTEQLTRRCEPSKYFLSWKGTPSGASNFGLDGGTEKKYIFLQISHLWTSNNLLPLRLPAKYSSSDSLLCILVLKPCSWTYNFVKVAVHNLDSSQT